MVRDFEVGDTASLAPGTCRTVEVQGRRLALCNVDGAFYAVDDSCTHRGGSMGAGCLENGQLMCPLHGWAFDPRTGACLTREDKPLRSYPVSVREGKVWVTVDFSTRPAPVAY
ncbi:MAG TPA: Rieske 2Fe-2S domain-containing protein [Candidatus Limnocylindria bacterium]|jgi:nitrite reductase/ring-hydroxylating ferredoxin subunit|nr:Rieske 2Fe-2S domain-containing protein [Candidatus Limnocylindria bacterium]